MELTIPRNVCWLCRCQESGRDADEVRVVLWEGDYRGVCLGGATGHCSFLFSLTSSVKTLVHQTQSTSSSKPYGCTLTSPELSCSSRSGTPWRPSVRDGISILLSVETPLSWDRFSIPQMTGPLCCWPTMTSGRPTSRNPPQWPTRSTTSLCPRPQDHWWTCPMPGQEPVSPTTVSAQHFSPLLLTVVCPSCPPPPTSAVLLFSGSKSLHKCTLVRMSSSLSWHLPIWADVCRDEVIGLVLNDHNILTTA